jgi:hypothetical protein
MQHAHRQLFGQILNMTAQPSNLLFLRNVSGSALTLNIQKIPQTMHAALCGLICCSEMLALLDQQADRDLACILVVDVLGHSLA